MKKMLGIMVMMMMLCTGLAMAETRIEANYDLYDVGDDQDYKIDRMNFWDRLWYELGSSRVGTDMSVVGGALCSRTADLSEQFEWTNCDIGQTAGYYHTNEDHIGLVFQMFRVNDDGSWTLINEEKLSQGETARTSVDCQQEYHIKVFFCDDTSEDWTCEDNSDASTSGSVTFTNSDGQSETYYDTCEGPNTLLERQCDMDNSPITETIDCECKNGACVDGTSDEGTGEQCTPKAISSYYCSSGNVVRDYQYADCSEGTEIFEYCDNDEKCENGQCVSTAQTITCYQCQEGEIAQKEFEDMCEQGWTATKPDSCANVITCYQCQSGEVITQTFENSCEQGWMETRPDSCGGEELIPCYKCEGGEVVSEMRTSCDGEWGETRPEKCSLGFWGVIIRFFNNIFGV